MSLTTKFSCFFIIFYSTYFAQNIAIIRPAYKSQNQGMTVEEYTRLINSKNKSVLVFFEADWCAICKKLKPILAEIAIERKDKIELLNINTDDNPKIAKHIEIDGLPVMILYKNGKIVWSNLGFLPKKEILGNLDVHQ